MEVEENKAKINSFDALLVSCKEDQVEGLVARISKATSSLWRKLDFQ